MKQFSPLRTLSFALFSCFLLFVLPSLNGQTLVEGRVTDATSGDPLVGATVAITDGSAGANTDDNGAFSFTSPKAPPFEIRIAFASYEQQVISITESGQDLDIKMESSSLAEVEIVASASQERQKQSALTLESMSLSAIKETPAANFYEGLGNLKGVDLTSASLGFKVINTRGFNSTSPVRSLQLIDGVDNQSPGLNFSLGNFLGASELDVESVDLVVGASSAFYGPNAFNGVISMKTKDPFVHKGVALSLKGGERNLVETAFRYADVVKNAAGQDKFAFKLNLFYLRADDWEADNAEESYRDVTIARAIPYVGEDNPGGYDAVNRYGDEILLPGAYSATSGSELIRYPGQGIFHRTGYWERDLVNYDTRNFKSSVALHYKLTPKTELIGASAFSTGTTVYQGDNRYSLNDILFFQHRLELRQKDKFFIRAYMTHEDAGNTYDAVFTAFEMQELGKSDQQWATDYNNIYRNRPNSPQPGLNIVDSVRSLEGFPTVPTTPPFIYDFDRADSVLNANNAQVSAWHQLVRDRVDNNYLEPGTPEFNAVFQDITSRPLNAGGTRLIDLSALYHVHGEYKFDIGDHTKLTSGANGRLYTPNTQGTIFLDTTERITNFEFGVYSGLTWKSIDEKLRANASLRLDKNQNFNPVLSPAASLVWTPNSNYIFRASLSSAVRNPTLADQFLYYNVGRAILLGNLNGIEDLITVESFGDYSNTLNSDTLAFFDVPAIQPEKVRTFEVGARTTFDRLYLDASYYYSAYRDFLGFQIGLDVAFAGGIPSSAQAYRVAANATDIVTTQGFSLGANYFLNNGITLNGNYSWNRLNTQSDDPIIPAFNTPEHKFNLGITGRDVKVLSTENWGFSVNYKWIDGFLFEGSPQFTGFIESYDLLDAQVNKRFPKANITVKLGASNLLDNRVVQVYGGPAVGRLAYLSLTYDWLKK